MRKNRVLKKCEGCGNDFKDITGLKDLELESELMNHIPLWDIENGRTLCVPCHRKTDSYGRNLPTN